MPAGGNRSEVKIDMDLADANGKMWDFSMVYHDLPEDEDGGLGNLMSTLADMVKNTKGGAGQGDRSYTINFKAGKGAAARATNLKYSQAVDIQAAGVKLLQDMVQYGKSQVKSGSRT